MSFSTLAVMFLVFDVAAASEQVELVQVSLGQGAYVKMSQEVADAMMTDGCNISDPAQHCVDGRCHQDAASRSMYSWGAKHDFVDTTCGSQVWSDFSTDGMPSAAGIPCRWCHMCRECCACNANDEKHLKNWDWDCETTSVSRQESYTANGKWSVAREFTVVVTCSRCADDCGMTAATADSPSVGKCNAVGNPARGSPGDTGACSDGNCCDNTHRFNKVAETYENATMYAERQTKQAAITNAATTTTTTCVEGGTSGPLTACVSAPAPAPP